MPLQKLPPNGPLSVSTSANQRPPLQHRRRTLQTISELSATEGSLPEFVSSIGIENIRRLGHDNVPGVSRSTSKSEIRQSIPQHHPSPSPFVPRPPTATTPSHGQEMQHAHSIKGRRPRPMTMEQVDGWNAKRERARTRQELAITEARARQDMSDQGVGFMTTATWPDSNSRYRSTKSPVTEQALLKSSDSCFCLSSRNERRASFASTNNTSKYEARPEAPERASTDSSSYQSRDSFVNRSRSGSSNTSYTSQDAPPLLNGASAEMTGYCAELILQNQNLVSFGESARSNNINPSRSGRSLSLPADRFKHTSALHHQYAIASDLRQLPQQQPRQISAQRARNQALAALTALNSHTRTSQKTQYPTSAHRSSSHQSRHASLTSHPPSPSTHRKSASPHRNSLRYHAQLEAQRRITSPSPVHVNNLHHTSQHRQSDISRRVSFEQRTVPKRESLTQWKREREEAKASSCTDHKTRTQERVRRANELEEEKEKELVSMGKRASKVESRSCFGGLFAVLRGKKD